MPDSNASRVKKKQIQLYLNASDLYELRYILNVTKETTQAFFRRVIRSNARSASRRMKELASMDPIHEDLDGQRRF